MTETITYYKATRPDGTDFQTGTIDYAAALSSGEVIRHPAEVKVRNEPRTYLSVSVSAADCTGASWPCRLFRVEPDGDVMSSLSVSPSKRAVSALRVIEELPAWQTLGPNGEAVVALIERAGRLKADEAKRLAAAADAAWDAAWAAAGAAAGAAAWAAARAAARAAAADAAWDAAWAAAWAAARAAAWAAAADAAGAAAGAYLVRDLITPEQFDVLAGPWLSVVGEPE
jgi:hypothetical protein